MLNFLSPTELTNLDRKVVWHPYASMPGELASTVVVGANKTKLQLADGRWVEDAMSSWWSVIHGYNNPRLNAAAHAQIDSFSHVMFGGITHEPAVRLCSRLAEISGYNHVFLADSGSVSVEVALKMARQVAITQDGAELGTKRHKIAALRGGYHGDTWGAMSVTDPEGGMHELWKDALEPQVFLPRPPAFVSGVEKPDITSGYSTDLDHQTSLNNKAGKAAVNDQAKETVAIQGRATTAATDNEIRQNAEALAAWKAACDEILRANQDSLAAIICEPVLQGAGGMFVYSPESLKILRDLADTYNLTLIFDEIATGFGRTGKLFASEYAHVKADIVTVGKALTGGYMSFAAVLVSQSTAQRLAQSPQPVLMHGPTFMGNPLACAIANANLDILATDDWEEQVRNVNGWLHSGLQDLATAEFADTVASVRDIGAVGVVELHEPVDMACATQVALDNGVWIRPFGKLVYTMPPYISAEENVAKVTNAMRAIVVEQQQRLHSIEGGKQ